MSRRETGADLEPESIDERGVADYLLAHNDFFERHGDLLTKLKLRHSAGDAVSLIERQVELLRNQNFDHSTTMMG